MTRNDDPRKRGPQRGTMDYNGEPGGSTLVHKTEPRSNPAPPRSVSYEGGRRIERKDMRPRRQKLSWDDSEGTRTIDLGESRPAPRRPSPAPPRNHAPQKIYIPGKGMVSEEEALQLVGSLPPGPPPLPPHITPSPGPKAPEEKTMLVDWPHEEDDDDEQLQAVARLGSLFQPEPPPQAPPQKPPGTSTQPVDVLPKPRPPQPRVIQRTPAPPMQNVSVTTPRPPSPRPPFAPLSTGTPLRPPVLNAGALADETHLHAAIEEPLEPRGQIALLDADGNIAELRALEARTILGRGEGDVQMDDPSVSLWHAQLSFRHGKLYLKDMRSHNGVYLRLHRETTLEDKDQLRAGAQLFQFRDRWDIPQGEEITHGSPLPMQASRLVHQGMGGYVVGLYRLSQHFTIGRTQGDLRIPEDATLSPLHMELHRHRDTWTVHGASARAEVYRAIQTEMEVRNNDTFLVGDQKFRIILSP